ncbi:alpha-amylase family glycosyl hydrolase [Lewinella sp. LCG006]|uniref:alpha-amylase family glycosyl hydrolase n=1 Tax=Lewinella sp. LCG006 TaxID=3231911 RepID=UPI00345F9FCD
MNGSFFRYSLLSFALFCFLFSCKETEKTEDATVVEEVAVEMPRLPDWQKNATIYEVNLRHYTPEGTFNAFASHLPRLKEMGVDILWLMPIHPVSVARRKGGLGSPYAVADYLDVNPDFGTMDDFKALLKAIHDQGMYCIIDWVPNHTGWDNPWITAHPDWYTQDAEGNIVDPINPETGESWGWTDVADLNYDNPEMRRAMIDAMAFWVKDIGIDGFRVDVAHGVPLDFWEECNSELYQIKPLFMLAESAIPDRRNSGGFVMDYGWEMHHLLNEIAKYQGANRSENKQLVQGNLVDTEHQQMEPKTALDIDAILAQNKEDYHQGYFMQFTSNHDENAWAGTEFQRMGDGHLAFAVLTATFDGMPLLYTGMESAVDKQYEFFEKDEIEWGNYVYADFYHKLFDLKHRNEALWNGEAGGELVKIPTGNDENIYAFTREKNGDKVVVIINLSAQEQALKLTGDNFEGTYADLFSGEETTLTQNWATKMAPWSYHVLHREKE